ncbi:MAG TPA: hypothetical protein VJL54_02240 [Nitrososphaera sp.]|nr:hypothetical protein [Nitrososphaera sp.]
MPIDRRGVFRRLIVTKTEEFLVLGVLAGLVSTIIWEVFLRKNLIPGE